MAEGYAQATGKPGVVLMTSGPGTSNLATPMFNALLDGNPMVAVCGQVATSAIGSRAFQEIDVPALAKSCTKWFTVVQTVEDLPLSLDMAFQQAIRGGCGPALVAIPQDISSAIFDKAALERACKNLPVSEAPAIDTHLQQPSLGILQDTIKRVAGLVNVAEQPVIIAGQGVLKSSKGTSLLASVSEACQIPVATTLLGLGCFDETKDESLHMVGTHGAVYANYAVQNADLILALGARLDQRVVSDPRSFAPNARTTKEDRGGIVYFDINPASIGKVVEATEFVNGDLSQTLPLLMPHLQKRTRPEWLQQIQGWKKRYASPPTYAESETQIVPAQVLRELDRQLDLLPTKAVLSTGVGQHQMWAARCHRWQVPRTLVTSGSLGTMGFGLPASIGAKIGSPGSLVIDIDGDGSFCMTMAELLTASQYGVGIKVIVFNNGEQRMVSQFQQTYYQGRVAHARLHNPDFVSLAKSMGCDARRCVCPQELRGCIEWLLRAECPALLDMTLHNEPPMLPIVRSGASLDAFLFE
jgi:acetolactate synthase-1/2/3 large subunit